MLSEDKIIQILDFRNSRFKMTEILGTHIAYNLLTKKPRIASQDLFSDDVIFQILQHGSHNMKKHFDFF